MRARLKGERPDLVEKWHDTPKDILNIIRKVKHAVEKLRPIGNEAGIDRQFTLDGRLLGDIGELVIARHFCIQRHKKPPGPAYAHDLCGLVNGREVGVQVKLRCKATGPVGFKYQPDVLVVLEFEEDWSRWRIVFHGSGGVVARKGITVDNTDRRLKQRGKSATVGLTLKDLEEAHLSGLYARLTLERK